MTKDKMRKKQQKQMPLIEPASGHPQDMELGIISQLIEVLLIFLRGEGSNSLFLDGH